MYLMSSDFKVVNIGSRILVRSSLESRVYPRNWSIIHNAIMFNPANDRVEIIYEGILADACSSLLASDAMSEISCGYCLRD